MSVVTGTSRAYKTLDAWRGAASLWVVIYHVAEVIVRRYPQMASNLLIKFSLFGALGVQIFFVISGYCIANAAHKNFARGESFNKFMVSRIRRIYPPLWFATGLTILVSFVATILVASGRIHSSALASVNVFQHGWLYLLSNLTLTTLLARQPMLVGQAWTLCYEVAFYLIMGVMLIVALRSQNERFAFQCVHGLTIICLLALIAFPFHYFYPMDLWAQFGLGVLLYDLLSHPQQKSLWGWTLVTSLLIIYFAFRYNFSIGYLGEPSRLTFLFSLIFAGLLMVAYRHDERVSQNSVVRFFSWLGLFSYSLYLTHLIFVGIVSQAVKIFGVNTLFQYVAYFLTVILSVGFAYLFFHFCERPFLNLKSKTALLPNKTPLVVKNF